MKNQRTDQTINRLVQMSFKNEPSLRSKDRSFRFLSKDNNTLLETQVKKITNTLALLPRQKALIYLTAYLKGLKRYIKQYTLFVESPALLTGEDLSKITMEISKKYSISDTKFIPNPKLFGGVKIRIGDNIYNNTIEHKIKMIGEAIIG